jgi:hypothetical protein
MQERLAAINPRLDVTESETARLAAERVSLEDERRELERAVLVAKEAQGRRCGGGGSLSL